jgi:hypothetical protein
MGGHPLKVTSTAFASVRVSFSIMVMVPVCPDGPVSEPQASEVVRAETRIRV